MRESRSRPAGKPRTARGLGQFGGEAVRVQRGPSGRVRPSCRRILGGDGGRLEWRLDDGEAGRRRVGKWQRNGAVVVQLHDAGDGNERRIKAAGARSNDDVATLERVAAD